MSAGVMSDKTCLENCDCFGEEKTVADCSRQNLNKIPENLNTNLYYIDLSSNGITEIRMYELSGYKSIRILNLSNNGINKIYENSFQELVHLKYLYLSENKILHFPSAVFSSNENLQKLYLKGNPLSFSDGTSILVSDSITYLDIAFCNLTILPAETFATIPNLVALRLDGNPLTNITTEIFEPLRNLREIYMESQNSKYAESSFNEFLSYLRKRGIMYYGPRVCSEEYATVPSTINPTVRVSTSAVSTQTHTELTSAVPRTAIGILETTVPLLNQKPLFFNETRHTANVMSVTSNPLLQGFRHETQVHEESTSETLSTSQSSNLTMKSINDLTMYIGLFCVALIQELDSLKHPWRYVTS
jgi:hypothetical protein